MVKSSLTNVTTVTVSIIKKNDDKGGQFASVFRWYAETQGYEWARSRLVARQDSHPKVKLYSPDKTLYRTFAALKPTREDIRRFADTFGPICLPGATEPPPKGVFGSVDQMYGLTLSDWKFEIGRMREFVALWDAIKNTDACALRRVIIRHRNRSIAYQSGLKYRLLATPLLRENRRLVDRFDAVKSALHALRGEINARLTELHVAPRLVWCPGPLKDYRDAPTPDHHLRIVFFPSDLLGAMWLQFAQDVATKHVLSACSECGALLPTGPGGWRRGTKTCSPRCRQARKRRLRPEAEKLAVIDPLP